jgi:DNA-binding NarL/FixJ family response regulator
VLSAPPASRPRNAAVPATRISVLLVDDQAVVREAIRALLRHEPGIVVVGEARDGLQAVAMTERLAPDVVLMDIGMPNMNGIEATRRICEVAPRTRVLILSAHSDDHYIRAVMAMGAVGYVLKHSSLANLVQAIRKTGRGCRVVSPVVRKRLRLLTPTGARAARR